MLQLNQSLFSLCVHQTMHLLKKNPTNKPKNQNNPTKKNQKKPPNNKTKQKTPSHNLKRNIISLSEKTSYYVQKRCSYRQLHITNKKSESQHGYSKNKTRLHHILSIFITLVVQKGINPKLKEAPTESMGIHAPAVQVPVQPTFWKGPDFLSVRYSATLVSDFSLNKQVKC